ncbi:MAG: macrolide ABC transporter ATP-binding protein, partial [Porticoccaceae bacterium]|nr:macrolide ABC transporter ATP-binding protein [Porticoccaceae bacterium]
MTGANSLIHVSRLRKSYDIGEERVHALNSVDLAICEGEFVSVMGPSGSGKSTFMNMIGFLDSPSGGEVYFEGTKI